MAGSTQPQYAEIGSLSTDGRDLSEPRVFFTPDEIALARRRSEQEAAARRVLDRLVRDADEHLAARLAPLDERWWDAASTRPWQETYPDIYLHTALEPGRYGRAASGLAIAWMLTDRPEYADRACDLLLRIAPYQFRAEHYDVGMNYTGWGVAALTAYDILGRRFSASERRAIDGMMTRLAAAVLKNDIYWIENGIGGGINNHLAWHKAMLGLLGLFYDRPDLVRFCISGPRGLLPLLEDGLLDDGLWCESSLNYHFTAIIPMVWFAEGQRRTDSRPTLYEIAGANGRTLKQPFDAMFNVLSADGMIPPIGDTYGYHARLHENPLYESAWAAWRDERYAWLLRRKEDRGLQSLFSPPLPESPAAPPARTILLPEHGYALLRSHTDDAYWDTDARCAFFSYDRSNVHAHADRLTLILFGQKRLLLTDIEAKSTVPHAFSSRIQGELNRGGLSQNTVMIDGADQRTGPRMLRLVEFRDLPDEKRATAVDEEGLLYEGVRQMRTLAMTPDYLLDVFQVNCGERARQIDWIVHVMDPTARIVRAQSGDVPPRLPESARSAPWIPAGWKPADIPDTSAWRWLRDARSIPVTDELRMEWTDGRARLRLLLVGTTSEAVTCGYPSTDEKDSPALPMLIARTRGVRAAFAAVWLVGDAPDSVAIAPGPARESTVSWRVTCAKRTREHLVPRLG